jgi:hypothetical protein
MARGGYRTGAGRPKGSRSKSKAKTETMGDIKAAAASENLTPLEFMLKIMRDPQEDENRRARMAIAAAPFCHARKGDGAGKKEAAAGKAQQAGVGKFAACRPPLQLVKK